STHAELPVLPIGEVLTAYQIMLEVRDEPGVLARIAGILSAHGVSAASVEQNIAAGAEGSALLTIGTHEAREADLAETVDELRNDAAVSQVLSVIRLEGRA